MATTLIAQEQVSVIAHRGASSLAPENTLAAFSKAIDLGVDYIELDVRTSKDDSLVVIHDASLDRTTNGSGKVREYTWEVLQQFNAGYPKKFKEKFTSERIPALKEVLELAKGKTKVCIEIKAANEKKIVQLVEQLDMVEEVLIFSFKFDQLKRVTELNPGIRVLFLQKVTVEADIHKAAEIGAYGVGGFVASPSLVATAHALGLKIWRWTVNSTAKMSSMIESGFDGIITDYPQLLLPMLEENISTYPNPFQNLLNIEITNTGETPDIYIYNEMGEQVGFFANVDTPAQWNPIGFARGIYFIRARVEGKIVSKKVIYLGAQ